MDASDINDDFKVTTSLNNVRNLVVDNTSNQTISSGWYVLTSIVSQQGVTSTDNFWIASLDVNTIKNVTMKFRRALGQNINISLLAFSSRVPTTFTYDSFVLEEVESNIYDITDYYKDFIRFVQGQTGPNEYSARTSINIGLANFVQLLIVAYIETENNFIGDYETIAPI